MFSCRSSQMSLFMCVHSNGIEDLIRCVKREV